MLNLLKITPTHEDLFIERYGKLYSWALHLCDQDEDSAKEILHDAYIQFTTASPDLNEVRDLNAYLYGLLRHLRQSQERLASRGRFQQLSIVDYESVETGLKSIDPRAQIQAQDELRVVCRYACSRKETAKLGSVLILRFFHGYYPSEIVLLLQSPRLAVDKWLLLARREAKAVLDNPKSIEVLGEPVKIGMLPTGFAVKPETLLDELRQIIFHSKRGDCPSREVLHGFYKSEEGYPVNCEHLAHLVSCPVCLDDVNRMLDLPLLSERYPMDTIGKDDTRKPGTGGGPSGGGVSKEESRVLKRRAKEMYEHYPKELCVSINGYIQGSQKVSSDLSELDLNITMPEALSFIEVFSEQGIRLLLMSATEPPPEGPARQSFEVDLSEGRRLELTLKRGSSWPTLHLIYRNPHYKEREAFDLESLENNGAILQRGVNRSSKEGTEEKPTRNSLWERFKLAVAGLWQRIGNWGFWLRPHIVTTIFAMILIGGALFFQMQRGPVPSVSAAELLGRAAVAEQAVAAKTDVVLHRTINLEEKSVGGGLIARRRIEVWRSAGKGVNARRLFNEDGSLVAGEWARADGTRTVYRRGISPKVEPQPERGVKLIGGLEDVWTVEPSAKEFRELVGRVEDVRVEERPGVYVLNYEREGVSNADGIIKASLVLNRTDLRASEQTLTLMRDGTAREYHFTEATYEQRPISEAPPNAFEPDRELIGSTVKTERRTIEIAATPRVVAPVRATAALEVDALQSLNQVNALLGEQLSLSRTPEGLLRVQGIVETSERKIEILKALDAIRHHPAIVISVETVAEAQAHQVQVTASSSSSPVTIDRVEITEGTSPVYQDLRRRYSDYEARTFADRILSRSRQARRHALALKQIVERFTPDDLNSLEPNARLKFISMVRQHAQIFQRESENLRRELGQVFSPSSSLEGSEIQIKSDADLVRAVYSLYELALSIDAGIRKSFSVSADGSTSAPIKSSEFWRSIINAEDLATKLQRHN
jgi:DNA-directed RNA polymerase specialized sigma24 family protein